MLMLWHRDYTSQYAHTSSYGHLTYLSCFFQQDHLDFSRVKCVVNATIATVQENYLDCDKLGGEHLNTTLEELNNQLIYEGQEITKRPMDKQECFSSIHQFGKEVVQNIKERFPDLPVWSSMKIFDPQSYPTKSTMLRSFGTEEIETLIDHFGKAKVVDGVSYKELVDPICIQREWPVFKNTVFDNYRSLSFRELAKEIISKNISKLLQFISVLPMSSVPCERVRVKFRQQLTVKTVNSLLFV